MVMVIEWLYNNCKTIQMNGQHSLIQELMLYKFKLGCNAVEATKKSCCAKDEGAVDQGIVIRLFMYFHLGRKNLDNQTSSDMAKRVESKTMLQAIEANFVSSTQRVSG